MWGAPGGDTGNLSYFKSSDSVLVFQFTLQQHLKNGSHHLTMPMKQLFSNMRTELVNDFCQVLSAG